MKRLLRVGQERPQAGFVMLEAQQRAFVPVDRRSMDALVNGRSQTLPHTCARHTLPMASRRRPTQSGGWAIWLLGGLLLSAPRTALAAVSASHLPSDAAVVALVEGNGGGFRFATEVFQPGEDEGRLELRPRPVRAAGDRAVSRELEDWRNGAAALFVLTFDGQSRVTMTVTPRRRARSVSNLPHFAVSPDLNELFLRAEAMGQGTRVSLSHLVLNGAAITETATAMGGAAGSLDILRLRGANLAGGFTLTGSITMSWPDRKHGGGHHRPKLDMQIWAARVVEADTTAPALTITEPIDGSLVRTPRVLLRGTVTDDRGAATLSADGTPVPLAGSSFETEVSLVEGRNSISLLARDLAGNRTGATLSVTLDSTPPSISVAFPPEGQLSNSDVIAVRGEVADDSGPVDLSLSGLPIAIENGRFAGEATLTPGSNVLRLQAADRAGNAASVSRSVTRYDLPRVAIEFPEPLSFVTGTTIDVRGTIESPVVSLDVNSTEAEVSGSTFLARGVPLTEGGNLLVATAVDAVGHSASATISVVRDLTPPRLAVYAPVPGTTVVEDQVDVVGLVNDIVAGTVNSGQATVTVNGRPALVANRSFVAYSVPLSLGENQLEVVAVDANGNSSTKSIPLYRAHPASARVLVVSGTRQEAPVRSALSQPLVVALTDSAGVPLAGRQVLFRAEGNDGTFSGGRRTFLTVSDQEGRATASFTLGGRVGVQRVSVSAPGVEGTVIFSLLARPGPPAYLVVDSGDQQVGVAGRPLSRPLVVVVTDTDWNRLQSAAVRFTVVEGRGLLAGGTSEALVFADSDGRAIVPFALDPEEGIANNVVEAQIESLADGPIVTFSASGLAAGPPDATTIHGVVLDNVNGPLPGVTLRLEGTAITTETDERGVFTLVPSSGGAARLIVDGSTALRPGSWPSLEFVLPLVPGRENSVGMPIYLLPIDLRSGLLVDETHGGTLTLPDLPGFALDVAPGSVTFPGGSRSGLVSVTLVHNDKVPMVPNFGQQPRFIVTIQPAGARFDPPARMTLPNVEGLAPGKVTEMYSFDHDLGSFVSIGPATVSSDGSVIVANEGVGVLKAGWHCGGDPAKDGTLYKCPTCMTCRKKRCVPDEQALCKACREGKACDGEGNCRTGKELIPKICDQLEVVIANRRPAPIDDPVIVRALDCEPDWCYAGIRENLVEVTHSCDGASLLGAPVTEELSDTSSGGCPPTDERIGPGCTVGPGNKIVSSRTTSFACEDIHALCGPPDFFPMGTCTITRVQRISVGSCLATERTLVFTFTRTPGGCLPGRID